MHAGWIKIFLLTVAFLWAVTGKIFPQNDSNRNTFFIQPEILAGKNVANYPEFPESRTRSGFMLSLGTIHQDTSKHWVPYFNYPTTGVSLVYHSLGNPEVFSTEMELVPYVVFKTSRNPRRSVDFKIGLGASYFDNPYHETDNPENMVIGSRFNWAFYLYGYKNLVVKPSVIIKIGAGYAHDSNAHTELPNFGMNAALVSLAAQFPAGRYDPGFALKKGRLPVNREKHYFLYVRSGYGWHELGGTTGPTGGDDRPVYSQSLAGGLIFKQQLKVRMGLTYRFYRAFYEYVLENPVRGLGENPLSEASNVNFFMGLEFLMGRVALDIEGGLNLHKPFYEEFNYRWEFKEGFGYWRNRYLTSRLGVKYYLITNERMPRHNVCIGTHINANFGEADFMDISLGYTYLLK